MRALSGSVIHKLPEEDDKEEKEKEESKHK